MGSDTPRRSPPNGAPPAPSPKGWGEPAHTTADDPRWVALVVLGDRAAFAEMFRAYAGRLAAYAYSLVESADSAEEIVQQVFVSIWQRREQWVIHGTLKQYLYASVRNASIDSLKRRRVRRRFRERALGEHARRFAAPEPGADVALESAEISARVREAIESLPEQQRAVIRLRWLDQLSHGEIAGVLGISVKTSENHANRAMQRLRQLLAPLRP